LEFFDKADERILVFYTDAKDQLVPQLGFPGGLKKKSVFFRKKTDFVVTNDSVKTLEFGDISYSAAEQMAALVGGVVLPVLTNKDNSDAWPGVVADDVVAHANVGVPLACCPSLLGCCLAQS
jgi:hypothetical protein